MNYEEKCGVTFLRLLLSFQGAILTPSFQQILVKRYQAHILMTTLILKEKDLFFHVESSEFMHL